MSKLRGKQADRVANGLILLVFGFLLLLIQLRVTNHWLWMIYINTPSTFFLIAGSISLWLKREKFFGYMLTAIGAIGYSNIAFGWWNAMTPYFLPIVVMMAGVTVLLFAKLK